MVFEEDFPNMIIEGEAISDFEFTRNFEKEKDLTKFNPRVFDIVHLKEYIQYCCLDKAKVKEAWNKVKKILLKYDKELKLRGCRSTDGNDAILDFEKELEL